MNISMGVFMNVSKIKLVLLQDTVYYPENSSLPSAQLSFLDAPEIRKTKKKSKREFGTLQAQQESRTCLNLSKEKH